MIPEAKAGSQEKRDAYLKTIGYHSNVLYLPGDFIDPSRPLRSLGEENSGAVYLRRIHDLLDGPDH
jgi:hypothetical protein